MQMWFVHSEEFGRIPHNLPVQTYLVKNKIIKVTDITENLGSNLTNFILGNFPNITLVAELEAGYMDIGPGYFVDSNRNFYIRTIRNFL